MAESYDYETTDSEIEVSTDKGVTNEKTMSPIRCYDLESLADRVRSTQFTGSIFI